MEATINAQYTIAKEVKNGITIHRISGFLSTYLNRPTRIDVFLPPDYVAASDKDLPVLFFNDGQDMKAVKLTQTLHQLYLLEKIPSIIVVGIHAGERLHEYGTAGQLDYKGRGSKAGLYAHFITKELLPFIQKKYPCSRENQQTAFAGFSLGGLSAMDITWNNPQHFGKVGVFSGALWWRRTDFTPEDPDAGRIMHEIVLQDEFRPNLKFWFQTGTLDEKEDRNNNGIIDAIDDTMDIMAILKKKGYPATAMHYREVEGGIHHPSTWARVLPEFLIWCFRS